MDTNQFTSELVQFSQVEQQITTNSSLTTLIQATQGSETVEATAVVGKQVTVSATQVPLQSGTGAINFTTTSAEPVSIKLTNSSGVDVKDVSLTSTAGSNTWNWDGTNNSGTTLPDGLYTATVTGGSSSAATALAFTVTGTATGVTNSNGTVSLQMGSLSTPFSNLQSVGQ
jgi:flagellar basal-body rod modification protein FlgD